jgi:hypothetical protein
MGVDQMLMKDTVTVLGMKRMKGAFEGNAFSFTKIYVEESLGDENEDVRGKSVIEYRIGDFDRFADFQNLNFPLRAELAFENVAVGKGKGSLQLKSFKPVEVAKKPA